MPPKFSLGQFANMNVALFPVAIIGLALVPVFGNEYHLTVMTFAGLNALAAVGLNLLLGYTGQVSFGQNAFIGVGAYGTAVLCKDYGFEPWMAIICAVIITTCLGLAMGIPTLRIRGHYLALATVALGFIMYTLFIQTDSITGGFIGLGGIPRLDLGIVELKSNKDYYIFSWAAVIIIQLGLLRLTNSGYGRTLRAIRDDEVAARGLGIPVTYYKVQIFAMAASLAGLSGAITAHYITYISPESFSVTVAIYLIVVLYVGGLGTLWGPIAGVVLLAIITEEADRLVEGWNQGVYGVLLILAIIFMPAGVVGQSEKWIRGLHSLITKRRSGIAASTAPKAGP